MTMRRAFGVLGVLVVVVAIIASASSSQAGDACTDRKDAIAYGYYASFERSVSWRCGAHRFAIVCSSDMVTTRCACSCDDAAERTFACEGRYCGCNPAGFAGKCNYPPPPPGPTTCLDD
jgi:hypothetical protein